MEVLESLNQTHNAVVRFYEECGKRYIRVAIEGADRCPTIAKREVTTTVQAALTEAVEEARVNHAAHQRRSNLRVL